MSISSSDFNSRPPVPHALPLHCGRCYSDYHLVIGAIDDLDAPSPTLVEVSYICTKCMLAYRHPADVADIARLLNRLGETPDVLVFGGHYVHCGQPMKRIGSELRSINVRASTDQTLGDSLGVYLATRVLRCDCGFQVELPD